MCDIKHVSRSMFQRIRYENNKDIRYNKYVQRLIEDQEIYEDESKLDRYGKQIIDIYAE